MTVLAVSAPIRCATCHEALEPGASGDEPRRVAGWRGCCGCGTALHTACWALLDERCPTPGCARGRRCHTTPHATPHATPQPVGTRWDARRVLTRSAVFLAGVGAGLLAVQLGRSREAWWDEGDTIICSPGGVLGPQLEPDPAQARLSAVVQGRMAEVEPLLTVAMNRDLGAGERAACRRLAAAGLAHARGFLAALLVSQTWGPPRGAAELESQLATLESRLDEAELLAILADEVAAQDRATELVGAPLLPGLTLGCTRDEALQALGVVRAGAPLSAELVEVPGGMLRLALRDGRVARMQLERRSGWPPEPLRPWGGLIERSSPAVVARTVGRPDHPEAWAHGQRELIYEREGARLSLRFEGIELVRVDLERLAR